MSRERKTTKRLRWAPALPLLLVSQALAGCALLGIGTEDLKPPANVVEYAKKIPRIEGMEKVPSSHRLCEFQRQHAKQEAFLDGTIEKKKVVYAAPCDMKPKKPNANTS